MFKTARQSQIRRLVEERGQVTVTELNGILDVSEATIRRDLEQMAGLGWVQRTHGGAVKVEPAGSERPIKQRLTVQTKENERVRVHMGIAALAMQQGLKIDYLPGAMMNCTIIQRRPSG